MSRLTFKKEFQNPGEKVNCACIDMHTYNRVVNEKEEHYYLAGKVIDKLADFEDKQEQGLLIELPCKVGDKVYIIVGKDISEQKIWGYKISSADGMEIYTQKRFLGVSDFGKTVFLTRSEAEEALAKMGE